MRRLALIAALLLASAACNSGDNPAVDVDPTTTTEALTTTTAASAATTVAGASAKTPDAAADGLFERWQKNDKNGASRFARPSAIEELFSHPNTGDVEYVDQGCSPLGGAFDCAWTYPGGALHMSVEDVPGGGYLVDLVTYTAD